LPASAIVRELVGLRNRASISPSGKGVISSKEAFGDPRGTVASLPACFLTGDSHEERSSEGTLTEEQRKYWGCGLRPATGRAAFQE